MERETDGLGLLNPGLHELEERIGSSRQDIQDVCENSELWERIIHETTGGQIQIFNAKYNTPENGNLQWDKTFMPLEESRFTSDGEEISDEQVENKWRRMRTGLFKQIQDCWCRPEHRIFNIRTCSEDVKIDACLLSPDFISDEILVKLGIAEFEDAGDSRAAVITRLRAKANPEVMEKLKDLVKSLKIIQEGNSRILRMPDGRIFYISENSQSANNGFGPKKKVQIFDSYGAYRKTFHEQESYGNEIWNVVHIQRLIERINKLLGNWTGTSSKDEKDKIERETMTLITECADILESSLNPDKQDAARLLRESVGLTSVRSDTGTEFKCPTGTMAKMQKVLAQLRHRLREISDRGSFNERDSYAFSYAIARGEQTFNQFADDFEAAALNGGEIDPDIFGSIAGLDQAPFNAATKKILELQEKLNNGDPDARVKIHIVSKFQRYIVFLLSEISELLMNRDNVDLSGLKRIVDNASIRFGELQIDPEQVVESYKEQFEAMQRRMEGIQRGLAHYIEKQNNGELNEKGLRAMLQRFKDYIDSIDPVSIIQNLPF